MTWSNGVSFHTIFTVVSFAHLHGIRFYWQKWVFSHIQCKEKRKKKRENINKYFGLKFPVYYIFCLEIKKNINGYLYNFVFILILQKVDLNKRLIGIYNSITEIDTGERYFWTFTFILWKDFSRHFKNRFKFVKSKSHFLNYRHKALRNAYSFRHNWMRNYKKKKNVNITLKHLLHA